MQPNTSITPYPHSSPSESINKLFRWQVILALLGIMLLLVTLLGYSTYTLATTLVPERGGVFREGVAGEPIYLSPLRCQSDNDVDQDLCVLLFRGLTRIDSTGQVVPDLAEDWTISNNNVYTFRLKPEQFWSDGAQITADDVLFTIGVIQDPDLVALPSLVSLWSLVQAEKVNDLTIRFTLSQPFAPFLDYTAIGLLPEHIWNQTPASELAFGSLSIIPISSGPFKIAEIDAQHIRLEPNPFFAGDIPYINSLDLVLYRDHPSVLAALIADEIDGASYVLPTDLPTVAGLDHINLYNSVLPSYTHIVFNVRENGSPALQDKQVRQALYHAINRPKLVQDVLADQGIVANSLLSPRNWAYNPNVPVYEFDQQRAAQLLNEAGWIDTNGDNIRDRDGQLLAFRLVATRELVYQNLIERIVADWATIGVLATPIIVEREELLYDVLSPRDFDAALFGWEITGDPDPYELWHSSQAENPLQNFSGWSNNEADQVIEQARATSNIEERKALYYRFQEIFADEAPAIMLYHPIYTYAMSKNVKNAQVGLLNHPSERFIDFADWYINEGRVPTTQLPNSSSQ